MNRGKNPGKGENGKRNDARARGPNPLRDPRPPRARRARESRSVAERAERTPTPHQNCSETNRIQNGYHGGVPRDWIRSKILAP